MCFHTRTWLLDLQDRPTQSTEQVHYTMVKKNLNIENFEVSIIGTGQILAYKDD